jgi:hypothetical protein
VAITAAAIGEIITNDSKTWPELKIMSIGTSMAIRKQIIDPPEKERLDQSDHTKTPVQPITKPSYPHAAVFLPITLQLVILYLGVMCQQTT